MCVCVVVGSVRKELRGGAADRHASLGRLCAANKTCVCEAERPSVCVFRPHLRSRSPRPGGDALTESWSPAGLLFLIFTFTKAVSSAEFGLQNRAGRTAVLREGERSGEENREERQTALVEGELTPHGAFIRQ